LSNDEKSIRQEGLKSGGALFLARLFTFPYGYSKGLTAAFEASSPPPLSPFLASLLKKNQGKTSGTLFLCGLPELVSALVIPVSRSLPSTAQHFLSFFHSSSFSLLT